MVHAFREKLAALMTERGIGVRELARRVPCDPGHISKLVHGRKMPSLETARRIDDVLDAGGELAATVPSAPRSPLSLAGINGGLITPDDEDRALAAISAPSRLDQATVDAFANVLAATRRLEDSIGSAPLVESVRAQLAVLKRLVTEAHGPIRPALVNVAGQYAQYAGWLHANTGHFADGSALMDRALEWATEAGDVNLISEAMSCKGNVAWLAGQIGPVIGLSAAAQRGDGLYPGQPAISALQEARGYAALGAADDAERKLDDAEEYADQEQARFDEAPPWLYYHVPGFYDLQRGQVYRLLGRTLPTYNRRAADTLTAGLHDLPAEMCDSEWAGDFMYQLGRAYLQANEREQAEAQAEELAALAEAIGSKRLRDQAAALR